MQCVNTVSVVRRNLLNIAHVNSARDFSTTIIGDARPTPRSHSAVIGYSPLSNIEQISIQLRCNMLAGCVEVRFAPDSDGIADIAEGPSCANRRSGGSPRWGSRTASAISGSGQGPTKR